MIKCYINAVPVRAVRRGERCVQAVINKHLWSSALSWPFKDG